MLNKLNKIKYGQGEGTPNKIQADSSQLLREISQILEKKNLQSLRVFLHIRKFYHFVTVSVLYVNKGIPLNDFFLDVLTYFLLL